MSKVKSSAGPPVVDASPSAKVVRDAIADRWIGSDKELAAAAGISGSSLADIKAKGVTTPTKTFRKLCRTLGLDVKEAVKGRLRVVSGVTTHRRADLHDMLNRLIGSADEATIERVMKGLLKAAD